MKKDAVNFIMAFDSTWQVVLTVFYQHIDKSWRSLQFIGIVVSTYALYHVFNSFEESPRYLYDVKNYKEARRVIKSIAH